MQNKMSISMVLFICILSLSIFLLGFNKTENKVPQTVYNVYLDGKIIGTIESQESFESYINEKEEEIKKKYKVDNIYTPNGVEIKKIMTYDPKIITNENIYNKLIKLKKFTIKGITVTIEAEEDKEPIVINVLNKEIFDEALNSTIKAFLDEEAYKNYMEGTQEEIKETGEIIENIDLQQKVTYKETLISTEEKIYTNVGGFYENIQ